MGGNRDGVSGPGVGAADKEVQGAEEIPAILVTVGLNSGACGVRVDDDVQAASRTVVMKNKTRYRLGFCIKLLMDRFQ